LADWKWDKETCVGGKPKRVHSPDQDGDKCEVRLPGRCILPVLKTKIAIFYDMKDHSISTPWQSVHILEC